MGSVLLRLSNRLRCIKVFQILCRNVFLVYYISYDSNLTYLNDLVKQLCIFVRTKVSSTIYRLNKVVLIRILLNLPDGFQFYGT